MPTKSVRSESTTISRTLGRSACAPAEPVSPRATPAAVTAEAWRKRRLVVPGGTECPSSRRRRRRAATRVTLAAYIAANVSRVRTGDGALSRVRRERRREWPERAHRRGAPGLLPRPPPRPQPPPRRPPPPEPRPQLPPHRPQPRRPRP